MNSSAAIPQLSETPTRKADPCVMVIFGASGDLTKRKLIPALCNLAAAKLLPDQFAIIGFAYNDLTTESFRKQLSQDIKQFATCPVPSEMWDWFVKRIYYVRGDFQDPKAYQRLQETTAQAAKEHAVPANYFYYLAVAPRFFGEAVRQLGTAGLAQEADGHWRRVIVEKPFGRDLESARALNAEIKQVLDERQIYRIDHYLGKETVTAMEPPISFHADAVRDEQAKVLHGIQPPTPEEVLSLTVRGQYGQGQTEDGPAPPYRAEPDVAPNSSTETFVALKLRIDNWRWADVPFYLRTGKRLPRRVTEIAIQFRRAPFQLFRNTLVESLRTNRLVIRIQPNEGISLRFGAKVPGPVMRMGAVEMDFNYVDYFGSTPSTGYERLIYDCMIGDATLFQRADMVEAGWSVITPVLDVWKALPPRAFPNYEAGSWGPKEADELLARDGREWRRIE